MRFRCCCSLIIKKSTVYKIDVAIINLHIVAPARPLALLVVHTVRDRGSHRHSHHTLRDHSSLAPFRLRFAHTDPPLSMEMDLDPDNLGSQPHTQIGTCPQRLPVLYIVLLLRRIPLSFVPFLRVAHKASLANEEHLCCPTVCTSCRPPMSAPASLKLQTLYERRVPRAERSTRRRRASRARWTGNAATSLSASGGRGTRRACNGRRRAGRPRQTTRATTRRCPLPCRSR